MNLFKKKACSHMAEKQLIRMGEIIPTGVFKGGKKRGELD